MSLFATNYDSDNIALGPCLIYWKGPLDADFRHVGHTYGGVTLSVTQKAYELKSDQYGDTPLRMIDGGVSVLATINMTESTFDNLKMLFTTAEEDGSILTFGKPVGSEINTGELILEPTDGSSIIHIYKAAANIGKAIEIAYTTDKQRVYAAEFAALIDDSRESGDQLFRIGGWDSP